MASTRVFRPHFRTSLIGSYRFYSSQSKIAPKRPVNYLKPSYRVGDQLSGFTVTRVDIVPEFQLCSIQLKHDVLQTDYLHICREDPNNTFAVAFKTIPSDSTGVAHVLEHTALCGSKNFPCRDPFFKMLNRSLSTYMNAWTGSDFTMYPFSTQNQQDFKNLLYVYLDAAFFPNLRELDFLQEGWRLEHQDPLDPTSPIVFKGIVYNEMKGALSDQNSLFMTRLQQALHPSVTYRHVSGGDPPFITDLSWSQLRDFHRKSYHPSNAKFFSYGDMPLSEHLEFVSQKISSHFAYLNCSSFNIPKESKWSTPQRKQVFCAVDPFAADPESQSRISVSFLLNPVSDYFQTFSMKILSSLLLEGPQSPFYKSLIDSNIGSDYVAGTGYDSHTNEASFTVGLQNVKKSDLEQVEQLIMKTFHETATQGFDQERIDAILHQIELSQKHQASNFGLHIASALVPNWLHGVFPNDMLNIQSHLLRLKEELAKGGFFESKIKQNFLENCHKLTFIMNPDPEYNEKLAKQEKKKLISMTSRLSETQKENIFALGKQLLQEQDSTPNVSCLPTLQLKDIDRNCLRTSLDMETIQNVGIQLCEVPTNGITYFRALMDTSALPEDLKIYVPLFCDVLTKMGAGANDFRQLSQKIDLSTGGIITKPKLIPQFDDPNTFQEKIILSSHCLERNLPTMFELLTDIFMGPHLQQDNLVRLKTLILMAASDLSSSVVESGHSFAILKSQSELRKHSNLQELYSGLAQVEFIKNIAEMNDDQLAHVIEKLRLIGSHVLSKNSMRIAVNSDKDGITSMDRHLHTFLGIIPEKSKFGPSATPSSPLFTSRYSKHYQPLPSNVNFVAESFITVPYMDADHPSLTVLSKILSSKFLHREIREKRGAYGAGASSGSDTFTFYTYRDPSTQESLDIFQESLLWLEKSIDSGLLTESDLNEALLSTFSTLDSPVSPCNRGLSFFQQRITDDMRQTYRDRLFETTLEKVKQCSRRHLVGKKSSVTILGSQENLDTLKHRESWLVGNV